MFKKYNEYRVTKQFKKEQQAKQKLRLALIACAIMVPLLIAMIAIDAAKPAEPVKSAPIAEQNTPQDSGELSSSEQIQYEAEWGGKQAKYCLNVNQAAGFKEPELSKQYDLCIDETVNWPMEKFE